MIGIGLRVYKSAEAVELYIDAFGMELGYHVKNEDGSFFHSELMKDGEEQLAVVEAKTQEIATVNPVQLGYTFQTKKELEHALTVLAQSGQIKMQPCELPWSPWAAEVVDRFGVDWYLTLLQHRPEEEDNKMIGYCGLDCAKCDAHIATIHDDNELRMKTAEKWSKLNGVDITPEMINCDGCRVDGRKTPFCDFMCEIKKCAQGKNYCICSECKEMEQCTTLKSITDYSEEAVANLKK